MERASLRLEEKVRVAMSSGKTVVVRVDATSSIGSGHAMRCIAVAQAVECLGGHVQFAVSCEESAEFLKTKGYAAKIMGSNPLSLDENDSLKLAEFCEEVEADSLFIDTYAVTDQFFDCLQHLRNSGVTVGYLDDLFTFDCGIHNEPIKRPVDVVLNYSLYADPLAYSKAYEETQTKLLMGPDFVPLRREFWDKSQKNINEKVRHILVTTGVTNPNGTLERFAKLAKEAFPKSEIHVVVGSKSEFDQPCSALDVVGPQKSLLPLMKKCDVCLTAAGTTIYELCAVGVPTFAVAIVDNQLDNAQAFMKRGLGYGHVTEDADETLLADLAKLSNINVREQFSQRMRHTVSGNGAQKVASCLLP